MSQPIVRAGTGTEGAKLGDLIVRRIDELAKISETPEHLARIFLTEQHRAAADLLAVLDA